MAAPQLSTYQKMASSIYDPQLNADITSAKNTMSGNIANEEAGKGQIQTDYTTAVNNLKQAIQDQSAQINQLYTERLGGNFSGLQGNDMGQMFARANQQQATIESTRANKLAAITTAETNEKNTYNATVSSLKSKYGGLKSQYAQEAYGSAVKDYNDRIEKAQAQAREDAYRQAQLNLSYARLAQSGANSAASAASRAQSGYKVKQGSHGQYMYSDSHGNPISMAEYVANSGGSDNTIKNLLMNGTGYDKSIYNKVKGLSGNRLYSALSKYKVYGF